MISRNLEEPIARGRTADIFAWEGGQILKLFHNWFELENIHFEQKMARAIHAAGLPAPFVGDILEVNGKNGLVYERVVGRNMWEVLEKQPWMVFSLARQTAKLHAWTHATIIQVRTSQPAE